MSTFGTYTGRGALVENPAFKRWFGDSVVVRDDGSPRIMYHSGSFDEMQHAIFDTAKGVHFGTRKAAEERVLGRLVDAASINSIVFERGGRFYLDSAEYPDAPASGFRNEDDARLWIAGNAARYMDVGRLKTTFTAVYLSIQNPKRTKDHVDNWKKAIEQAKAEGHDGIVYENYFEDAGSTSFIAFDPRQIKSIHNRGTFDPADASILNGIRGR